MRLPTLLLLPVCAAALAMPVAAQDLPAAIADALDNAPALAAARAGEDAAAARLDRARAERNPSIAIEGSVGKGRIDPGGFFGLTAANTTPVAAQATAQMPLWAGGRIGAGIEQARLETVVGAVSAYGEVLTARQIETRFERTRTELAEVERQAALRFKAGEIAMSDLAQARARKAEAEAGLAQARGRRVSAEAAYARLTGKPAAELAPLPAPPPIPASLSEALDRAKASNPMLQQAREGSAIARAAARGARAEGMPSLGVYSEAAHVRDQFFPGYKADSLAVGLRGRWTLWAGGRTAAQTRAADADVTAAQAREREAGQMLEGAVIDAWQGYATATQVAEAARLRAVAAEEALRSTRLEAQVGAKPTLAVLDAEREATEAEATRIEAESRRLLAAWQLNALTGNLGL
jgi:outer membrane protein